ncbi:MAG TPA: CHAD domain-containing protein [Armatimonadota bacterium]|nr:CHAD domain-containing protein [Armatimonadota bacterium]
MLRVARAAPPLPRRRRRTTMRLPNLSEPLSPDAPLWAWAYEAIGRRAETMVGHLEDVRRGEDIEAVHDMRVWSRRLVAAMRVYRDCFPGPRFRRLLKEARGVTRRLGTVRDLDVLIDHYERLEPAAPAETLPAIGYLPAVRRAERRKARGPMLQALDTLETTHFPARLRAFLREEAEACSVGLTPAAVRGPRESGTLHAELSFREAAPLALEERHRELFAFAPHVDHPEAVEELHAMRIAAKWLRYTMELFAPAYADELKRPISTVKKLQELLGELHDSDVRLQQLHAALAGPLCPGAVAEIGLTETEPVRGALSLLKRDEQDERRARYEAFRKEWRKLEGRAFRECCLERLRNPDAAAGTPAAGG